MAMTIIRGPEGVRTLLNAGDTIAQLRTLQIWSGAAKVVVEAMSGYTDRPAGVAAESVVSGKLVRVTTTGIVSGVICASGVQMGDSLQIESASGFTPDTGLIAPLLSGVGAMFGKALMSGGRGSGISMLVDLG